MKGYLKKTEEGWFVIYDKRTMQDPSAEDGILPLHFEDVKLLTQYTDYSIDWDGKEVEWDRITEWDYDRTTYAKLINSLNMSDKSLEGYICPITKIQCDDECCVSAENCHIVDSNEMILNNCEEVKNWDNFAEQKNLELLAEEVYGKGIKPDYEEGFIDGYNKAKETLYTEEDDELRFLKKQLENVEYYKLGYNSAKKTLYTEEQVREAIKLAYSSNRRYLDWLENDIIQSLKKIKL